MGKPKAHNQLFLWSEPFPEHAKMFPYSQFEIIEEFFDHLRQAGVTDLTWVEVHDLLLDFRGVDRVAYESESAQMKVKYQWLFDQFGLTSNTKPKPQIRVTRPAPVAEPDRVEDDPGLNFLLAKIRGE